MNAAPPRILIDPADGAVHLAELALVIRPGLSRPVAEAMLATFLAGSVDHGNGYAWSTLRGLALEGMPCGLSLGFHADRLAEVHVGLALPDVEREAGWPTRSAIDREIGFVRRAFRSQLGRVFGDGPELFAWGAAWSIFDRKAFAASAGISYAAVAAPDRHGDHGA